VRPRNRGVYWPATAILVVHVQPRRTPLKTGGDSFPAWQKPLIGGLDEPKEGLDEPKEGLTVTQSVV
jgi:hypothetical protein